MLLGCWYKFFYFKSHTFILVVHQVQRLDSLEWATWIHVFKFHMDCVICLTATVLEHLFLFLLEMWVLSRNWLILNGFLFFSMAQFDSVHFTQLNLMWAKTQHQEKAGICDPCKRNLVSVFVIVLKSVMQILTGWPPSPETFCHWFQDGKFHLLHLKDKFLFFFLLLSFLLFSFCLSFCLSSALPFLHCLFLSCV